MRQHIHIVYIHTEVYKECPEVDHKIPLAMPSKKDPHTAFGRRLFALLKANGLTQTQLADAHGTTQPVISNNETDAEQPSAAAIVPLARLLEVSTDHLLGLEPAAQGGRQQPQQQRLWKRFQKTEALPTKDQRAVIRLINSLAGAGHAHAEAS